MTRWLSLSFLLCGLALTGCTSGGYPFGFGGTLNPRPPVTTYPAPGDMSLRPAAVTGPQAGLAATTPASVSTPVAPTTGAPRGGVSFVEKPAPTGWSMVTAPFTSAAGAVSGVFGGQAAQNDPTSLGTVDGKLTSETLVGWAKVNEQKGDVGEADKFYRQAIQANPKDLVARISYARMHLRQKNYDQATKVYLEAITLFPNEPTGYNDLAHLYALQGNWVAAVDTMTQAVKIEPTNKLYRGNAAMILVQAGRSDDALAQLIAVHPIDIAEYNLGYLLMQKGDQGQAARHFATALEANPNLVPARQMLARVQTAGDALARRDVRVQTAPVQTVSQPLAQPASQPLAQPAAPAFAWPAGNYVPNAAAPPAAAGFPAERAEGLPPVN